MTAAPFPRPLVPEDIDRRSDPARTLFRAMTSHVVARARARDGVAADVASEFWPSDKVTKAAVNPATVGTAAWAGNVSPTGVAAFLSGLAPRSAAAQLFEAALRVDLAGQNSVNVPRLSTNPAPNFVAEGAPIPVEQGTFADTAVGPAKKLAIIQAFTNELRDHSAESAEAIIRTGMQEAASKQLDAAVFSTTAADTTRPAGILNGVTPLTATAGGGLAALTGDLKLLAGAIADAGGGANIWLFANPRQAVALRATVAPGFDVPVIGTTALASGTIVAVEVGGIASAFTGAPDITASSESLLHFEDSTPLAIGTVGSPNTVAAPTRSLWQTDCTALRLILRCAWSVTSPGAVQVVNSVTW